MPKRFCDTEIWDKQWFMKLSPKEKCLVRFIFDKCDTAGVWTPNWALASAYIGEAVAVMDLSNFSYRLEFLGEKIFIPDFIEFQYGELTENCKPHRPIIQKLKKYGLYDRVLKGYHKGIKTLEEKETEKEKEKDQDLGKSENPCDEPQTDPSAIVPQMCEQFKEKNPKYPFDKKIDFPALREIAQKIKKNDGLTGENYLPPIGEKVKLRWGEMVDHISGESHFSKYSISQINKHFQSIIQSLNGSTRKIPGHTKAGTSAARIETAKNW